MTERSPLSSDLCLVASVCCFSPSQDHTAGRVGGLRLSQLNESLPPPHVTSVPWGAGENHLNKKGLGASWCATSEPRLSLL